jgi:phosphotriesterase-related protein
MTHTTHMGELVEEQLALLAEEGVTADHVIVSHIGDRRDPRLLLAAATRGAYLSIDNLAFTDGYTPLHVRADNVALLWREGFGPQVMLGNDICETGQWAANGGWGYANVIERFWPLLAERGITEEQYRTMTVDTPARAFAYDAVR